MEEAEVFFPFFSLCLSSCSTSDYVYQKLIERAYKALDFSDNVAKLQEEEEKAKELRELQDQIDMCTVPIIDVLAAKKCSFSVTGTISTTSLQLSVSIFQLLPLIPSLNRRVHCVWAISLSYG